MHIIITLRKIDRRGCTTTRYLPKFPPLPRSAHDDKKCKDMSSSLLCDTCATLIFLYKKLGYKKPQAENGQKLRNP